MVGGRIVKRLIAAAVALATTVAGCGYSGSGQVRVVDPHWPGEILIELNADAEWKQVVVEMLSGEELPGIHLHASTDSTVWYAPDDPGHRTKVRTSEIAMVHVNVRRLKRRTAQGVGAGVALGVLPIAIGVAGQPETACLGGFVGLLCGGAGGVVGALVGRNIEHEVEDTVTYVLNGPPPSAPGRE